MAMKFKNINIAFPEDLLKEIDRESGLESRTRSDLVRESVRVYLNTAKWKRIREYGEKKRYELGLESEDQVERIIDEFRGNNKK